jgi:hypothetical protein
MAAAGLAAHRPRVRGLRRRDGRLAVVPLVAVLPAGVLRRSTGNARTGRTSQERSIPQ